MENLYTPNCIRTRSGQYLDVFNPDPDKILIEDIAWALSNIPRFGGHLSWFYSVARHSIAVFEQVYIAEPNYKALLRGALLHDASEAYLMDLPSPIKNRMPEYKAVEGNLMGVIACKFDFVDYDKHPLVKKADKDALEREWEGMMLVESKRVWAASNAYYAKKFLEFYHTFCI